MSDQNSQEVCPWNVRFSAESEEPGYAARGPSIRRAGYEGFRRNVTVAVGNWLAGLEGDPPEDAMAALRSHRNSPRTHS